MIKPLLLIAIITLTGCSEGLVTKNTGIPYAIGSSRESTPATVASIDKLGVIQKGCYSRPDNTTRFTAADIKALSATGQAEYFRGQALAAMAREIRLAAGRQEADPCADTARAYYSLLNTREVGKWNAIGTGLKVVGLGLGIYATGHAIAAVVGAASAGAGSRIVNIGSSRGTSTQTNPGSVPAGSTSTPQGLVSSSGDSAFTLGDTTINLGDKVLQGSGSGAGLSVAAPVGFESLNTLSGSGILSGTAPQPIYQPGATQPVNNITPKSSSHTGILN